jgi:hypothetical protein
MGARSTWDAGQRMGAHAASLDVGCMRRVGACACVVTKERRTDTEERGPAYSMALSSVCFMCLDLCFIWMLHVFYPNVVYVLSRCCML